MRRRRHRDGRQRRLSTIVTFKLVSRPGGTCGSRRGQRRRAAPWCLKRPSIKEWVPAARRGAPERPASLAAATGPAIELGGPLRRARQRAGARGRPRRSCVRGRRRGRRRTATPCGPMPAEDARPPGRRSTRPVRWVRGNADREAVEAFDRGDVDAAAHRRSTLRPAPAPSTAAADGPAAQRDLLAFFEATVSIDGSTVLPRLAAQRRRDHGRHAAGAPRLAPMLDGGGRAPSSSAATPTTSSKRPALRRAARGFIGLSYEGRARRRFWLLVDDGGAAAGPRTAYDIVRAAGRRDPRHRASPPTARPDSSAAEAAHVFEGQATRRRIEQQRANFTRITQGQGGDLPLRTRRPRGTSRGRIFEGAAETEQREGWGTLALLVTRLTGPSPRAEQPRPAPETVKALQSSSTLGGRGAWTAPRGGAGGRRSLARSTSDASRIRRLPAGWYGHMEATVAPAGSAHV